MVWCCPHCQQALLPQENQLRCASGHSFDIARQGYVNLLPANHKHSKSPGDDKSMLQARRGFLQAGFYQPLQQALQQQQQAVVAQLNQDAFNGLDMGGGDGYFSGLLNTDTTPWWLSDISKDAVKMAAGRLPRARCAVASSFRLPLATDSIDLVLRNFAPSEDKEVARVLRPGGFYCVVTPNDDHLIELRQCLYDEPKRHTSETIEGPFELFAEQTLSYQFHLADAQQRSDLLAMTPMAWRANQAQRERWLDGVNPEISANFHIKLYQVAQ